MGKEFCYLRILLIGSGGREHALAWAISKSPSVENLWAIPGNPGVGLLGKCMSADPMDFEKVHGFCQKQSIDLVVVGPENPLAAGIADYLVPKGVKVFGPTRNGAHLEASKSAAKSFMERHDIPHARSQVFDCAEKAIDYIKNTAAPWVIKADGLAFGKGVTITSDFNKACGIIEEMLSGRLHGLAGKRIVIEEFLEGIEATAMALCDGNSIFPLPMVKDHKRVFEGDKGPMTGGMGAYSPLPFITEEIEQVIYKEILHKTLLGFKRDGIDYRGVIYLGLMITQNGPKVLEYNVRFGDPEAQCILPRISGDFAGVLMACADGKLQHYISRNKIDFRNELVVTVVQASKGYPNSYNTGIPIEGLTIGSKVEVLEDVFVFQAGTAKDQSNRLVTSGGRVLAISALKPTFEEARYAVYGIIPKVTFLGAQFRKDICKL